MDRLYYVYILASRSKSLYVGITSNLIRRVSEHREGQVAGFTSKYRLHRVVFFDLARRVAIAREKEIKGWRRDKKIALIESMNPTWIDLRGHVFPRYPRKADPSLRSG